MSQYQLGTVVVTSGSPVVTGTNTFWSANIVANDMFAIQSEAVWYDILSVDSDTQITLKTNYVGSAPAGSTYAIQRDFTPVQHFPIPTYGDTGTSSLIAQSLLQLDSTLVAMSAAAGTLNGEIQVAGDLVVTGTSILGVTVTVNGTTFANSSVTGSTIASSTIDSTVIGHTTPAAGSFTNLSATLPVDFKGQRFGLADANYTVTTPYETIGFTALTAARIVTLPAAAAYPPGVPLRVVDEKGACSATNTITVKAAGTDTINGAAQAVIANAYGFLELESNGSNAWTIVGQQTNVGLLTALIASLSTTAPTQSGQLWINGGVLQLS